METRFARNPPHERIEPVRVFIGLTEVANCIHNYSSGLRDLGVSTYTVVNERTIFYKRSRYDVVLSEKLGTPPAGAGFGSRLRRLVWRSRYYLIFARALLTCDVFIFIFGSGFRADRRDYRLLKKTGKRIVSVFLGDDTRYWYAYTQEAELLGTDADVRPYLDQELKDRPHDYLAVKLETVRKAEAHSDLILALPDAAQLQSRPYMRLNIPIDLSGIEAHVPAREVPLVVHAPSVRSIKGTDYVIAAVERLRSEGIAFEFRLIERMQNDELRELLARSDIVIDQLYSETIATFALEGMAAGNVVLARYLPDRLRIGKDCPVVNIDHRTLAERLRDVILDRELRCRLAIAGRFYVERYHSHVVVARQILEWLQPSRQEDPFRPTFFRDDFYMSRQLAEREAELLQHEAPYMQALASRGLSGVRFNEDEPIIADRAASDVKRRSLSAS